MRDKQGLSGLYSAERDGGLCGSCVCVCEREREREKGKGMEGGREEGTRSGLHSMEREKKRNRKSVYVRKKHI